MTGVTGRGTTIWPGRRITCGTDPSVGARTVVCSRSYRALSSWAIISRISGVIPSLSVLMAIRVCRSMASAWAIRSRADFTLLPPDSSFSRATFSAAFACRRSARGS